MAVSASKIDTIGVRVTDGDAELIRRIRRGGGSASGWVTAHLPDVAGDGGFADWQRALAAACAAAGRVATNCTQALRFADLGRAASVAALEQARAGCADLSLAARRAGQLTRWRTSADAALSRRWCMRVSAADRAAIDAACARSGLGQSAVIRAAIRLADPARRTDWGAGARRLGGCVEELDRRGRGLNSRVKDLNADALVEGADRDALVAADLDLAAAEVGAMGRLCALAAGCISDTVMGGDHGDA